MCYTKMSEVSTWVSSKSFYDLVGVNLASAIPYEKSNIGLSYRAVPPKAYCHLCEGVFEEQGFVKEQLVDFRVHIGNVRGQPKYYICLACARKAYIEHVDSSSLFLTVEKRHEYDNKLTSLMLYEAYALVELTKKYGNYTKAKNKAHKEIGSTELIGMIYNIKTKEGNATTCTCCKKEIAEVEELYRVQLYKNNTYVYEHICLSCVDTYISKRIKTIKSKTSGEEHVALVKYLTDELATINTSIANISESIARFDIKNYLEVLTKLSKDKTTRRKLSTELKEEVDSRIERGGTPNAFTAVRDNKVCLNCRENIRGIKYTVGLRYKDKDATYNLYLCTSCALSRTKYMEETNYASTDIYLNSVEQLEKLFQVLRAVATFKRKKEGLRVGEAQYSVWFVNLREVYRPHFVTHTCTCDECKNPIEKLDIRFYANFAKKVDSTEKPRTKVNLCVQCVVNYLVSTVRNLQK